MAKYSSKEKQYYCDACDIWIAEREMTSTSQRGVLSTRNGGYCPGCGVTFWCRSVTLGEIEKDARIVLLSEELVTRIL